MSQENFNDDSTDALDTFVDAMYNRAGGVTAVHGAGDRAISLRMNPHLVARIDGAAEYFKLSRNEFVVQLVEGAFTNFDEEFLNTCRRSNSADIAQAYIESVTSAEAKVSGGDE